MAIADGVLAPEELVMLERLSKQYFKKSEFDSWDQAFQNPMDLKQLAQEIAIADLSLIHISEPTRLLSIGVAGVWV